MLWEPYTLKGRQDAATNPRVSISKAGQILVNRAGFEALGEPSHVVIAYDKAERAIGLVPAMDEVPHAYRLCPPRGRKGRRWTVAGRSALRFWGVLPTSSYTRDATMSGNVLAVEIDARRTRGVAD